MLRDPVVADGAQVVNVTWTTREDDSYHPDGNDEHHSYGYPVHSVISANVRARQGIR